MKDITKEQSGIVLEALASYLKVSEKMAKSLKDKGMEQAALEMYSRMKKVVELQNNFL